MSKTWPESSNMINLTERRIASPSFNRFYDEGMVLVEETAAYLDGEGRSFAKHLSVAAANLYAAESMRLTTRLMQVSSWLLLHKAYNSGEMTGLQVNEERNKIKLDTYSTDADEDGWAEMDEDFLDLVARSLRLQHRVARLDKELYPQDSARPVPQDNPVNTQLNLLRTAFGK